LLQVVCRTVRVGLPDRPRGGRTVRLEIAVVPAARVARGPPEDQVQTVRVFGCSSGRSVAINGLSARGQRTVCPVTANRPPRVSDCLPGCSQDS
jgi:hypothetical protein